MATVHKNFLPFKRYLHQKTFTRALLECTKPFFKKTALIDPDDGREVVFGDLPALIREFSLGLSAHGFRKGERVATICGNSIDFIVFCLAAMELGIVVVPINPASKKGEIDSYLKDCSITRIISDGTIRYEMDILLLSSLRVECEGKEKVRRKLERINESDETLIFFSSGTTGPPKAIVHTQKSLISHLNQRISMDETGVFPKVSPNDVVHGVLPYFHFGGLMTTFLMLSAGATVIINKRWNEEGFLKNIQKYQVTISNVVPPILSFLAFSPLVQETSLTSLRRIYVGAAACDPLVIQKLGKRLPKVEITQLFGMTEGGLAILMSPVGHTAHETIGIPLPGVFCRLDEQGELEVKTPTLMGGYLQLTTDEQLSEDGWFKTGDLATVTSEGLFSISGRLKDTFKVRGWQVNPWELEKSIRSLPGVVDCAVVGMPHELDGHRPKAFVIGSVDPQLVLDHIKENFISYKRLEEAVIVESLPRNAAGKLLRRELQ